MNVSLLECFSKCQMRHRVSYHHLSPQDSLLSNASKSTTKLDDKTVLL